MGALGLHWVLPGRWDTSLEYGEGFNTVEQGSFSSVLPRTEGSYQQPTIAGVGGVRWALGLRDSFQLFLKTSKYT